MKRQRGVSSTGNGVNNHVPVNPTRVEDVAAVMGKKKVKKEKVVVVEEEKINESSSSHIEEVMSQQIKNWDLNWDEYCNMYMPPWTSGVDEQMSWGSTWFPNWDMDFMGESSFTNSLYNDVLWDDDIWNHNKEIPIPFPFPFPLHGKKTFNLFDN